MLNIVTMVGSLSDHLYQYGPIITPTGHSEMQQVLEVLEMVGVLHLDCGPKSA